MVKKDDAQMKADASVGDVSGNTVEEQLSVIDFKMVTFSLAGKDYGIDIMHVKEIAKSGNFTFVPNTPPFVLGVYNLRGEIIPIIDLRIFFNIPVETRSQKDLESMVIVSVDDQIFGVVVDNIDKVIGVSKATIQPPHPIFGDINIKYIHGVVENAGRLYILLEVNRIFSSGSQVENTSSEVQPDSVAVPEDPVDMIGTPETQDLSFITDTLSVMGKFYASSVNEDWLVQRYQQWRDIRTGNKIQIASIEDADEFLMPFASPFAGKLWGGSYLRAVMEMLPDVTAKVMNVWNIGCGSGHETYSLAVALYKRYPNTRIRIFANDSDLLAISTAPLLAVPDEDTRGIYGEYMVQTTSGHSTFCKEIKDMILFEYHDCIHQNMVPDADLIVARDVLSYMKPNDQMALVTEFREKLKPTGLIMLGSNEVLPKKSGWLRYVEKDIVFFGKE